MNVFVVLRVHGDRSATEFGTVCGVFRNLEDAKACLGSGYRAVKPGEEWILSEDPPGNNNYMTAELSCVDGGFDRFEITEWEVQ